jgi:hypothetical protein
VFCLQVVMTGGDNEVMMNSAAQLWSLGANVLITFSYVHTADARGINVSMVIIELTVS